MELTSEQIDEISDAVQRVVVGWEISSPPQPFTWAPDRHLRACLVKNGRTRNVILRRSWAPKNFEIETFLYRSVLPNFSVRTPVLWGTFVADDGQSLWIILEDVDGRTVRSDDPEDRKKFMAALGQLHGQGIRWLEGQKDSIDFLPRFDDASLPYAGKFLPIRLWVERLARGIEIPSLEIKPCLLSFPQWLLAQLVRQPMTLLHGDTDVSNGIIVDNEVFLIDFERACIGPPSLDLGKAVEWAESLDELEPYHSCFREVSGKDIPVSVLREWIDLGQGYNSLYWVSYYVERILEGNPLDLEWRERYYEPAIKTMCRLCNP